MMTWKELAEYLKENGVAGEGVPGDVRRLTAPARYRHRMQEVALAAAEWLSQRHGVTYLSEAGGLYGGGLADPGASTRRHPAFSRFPRRQSWYGEVWTAAIAAVGEGCTWDVVLEGTLCVLTPHPRLIPVADLLPTDDDSLLVAARRAVREAYPDKPYVVLAAAKLLAALRAEEVEAL